MEGRPDVSFSLAAVPDLLKTLQDCTADLQHYWNMIDPEQKKIAAPAVGDVRKVFTSDDYPSEALKENQEGKAQFLLFVDEQGKIPACYVLQPSGIPALDGMGCQVIRQRAKFKPAIDTAGKPIRSIVITPPVIGRRYG
jgi:TonB family protein